MMHPTRAPFASARRACAVILLAAAGCCAATGAERSLGRDELVDKIRGGWVGQMVGVAFGAPTEFKRCGRTWDDTLEWKAGMLENTIHQDDLYVEMTFARVMDDLGLDATCRDYGRAFRDSQYRLWHANAGARRVLQQGIEAPLSGTPRYNFHANDIDFQIEADFIGLMCPGLPRAANGFCDRVGRVMNSGDGLYGGMFVCGMYAAAFFESDPRRLVEAGAACIPAESGYGRIIADVLAWSAEHPGDWRRTWQRVEDAWNRDDPCPEGALQPYNIDAKLNGAYIAIGLLHGGGDFRRTMEIATRCGQDSDCNPSSAAGVLGVALGFARIPDEFKTDLPALAGRKFDYTDYSLEQIVASTVARALLVVKAAGGSVTEERVVVPAQTPLAPPVEQWNPGIADRLVPWNAPEWTFSGPWQKRERDTMADQAGAKAVFRFHGVAVALLGPLGTKGGRAEVWLDGRKQDLPLDAYIAERTFDQVLWQTYGLEPGEHTVEIVTTGQADARSGGVEVAIHQAVVYRAP